MHSGHLSTRYSQAIHLSACCNDRFTRHAAPSYNGVWGKGESARRRNFPQCSVRRSLSGRAKAHEEDRPLSYPLAVATLPPQFLGSFKYWKREGISLLFFCLIEDFYRIL